MVRVGAGIMTGMYFLKNFLFWIIILPEPSSLTTYWSYCRTSVIVPVLSHLVGCQPVWFCTHTLSLTTRCGRRFVCSDQRSAALMCLFLTVSSLVLSVLHHVLWGR